MVKISLNAKKPTINEKKISLLIAYTQHCWVRNISLKGWKINLSSMPFQGASLLPVLLSRAVIFRIFLGCWNCHVVSSGFPRKPEALFQVCIPLYKAILCSSQEPMGCPTATTPCWQHLYLLCCPTTPSSSCSQPSLHKGKAGPLSLSSLGNQLKDPLCCNPGSVSSHPTLPSYTS